MIQFCFLRLYTGIGIVPRRLLQRMARMDMDSNLKNLGQFFQVVCKNYQQNYFFVLPYKVCLMSSL